VFENNWYSNIRVVKDIILIYQKKRYNFNSLKIFVFWLVNTPNYLKISFPTKTTKNFLKTSLIFADFSNLIERQILSS